MKDILSGDNMTITLTLSPKSDTKEKSSSSSDMSDKDKGDDSSSLITPIDGCTTIVVWFSAQGHTKSVAQKVVDVAGADEYEIVPEIPYTAADLNYNNDNSRANIEQNNPETRPAISGTLPDMGKYDTILLGYPIWWGKAPRENETAYF